MGVGLLGVAQILRYFWGNLGWVRVENGVFPPKKKETSDDFPGQANGENVSGIGSCNGFSHKDSPTLDCRIGGFLNNPILYQGGHNITNPNNLAKL